MSSKNYLNAFFFVAAIACAIPVMLPTYPAMVDLPQHVAAVASIDAILHGRYPFSDLFSLKWLTPYWLGYFSVWVLGKLVGFVLATKIVVAVAIIGFVFACRGLRSYLGAPQALDWIFIIIPFGFSYQWGFLNFLIALPLGVFLIHQYLIFLDGRVHWARIVILFSVLFFAHLLVTLFVAGVCFLLALRPGWDVVSVVRRIIPVLVVIPLTTVWFFLNFSPSSEGGGPWEMGFHRIIQLLPNIFSLSISWPNVLVSIALLSVPWLLGGKLKFDASRVGPFVFYLVFMLVAPNYLMGNFFTYNRFNVLGFPLYLLCFSFNAEVSDQRLRLVRTWIPFSVPVISLIFLFKICYSHYFYRIEASYFSNLLREIPPEKRVLGMVASRNSYFVSAPVYLHYPLWYQVEKNGLSDFNFAYWPGLNLTYKESDRPSVDDNFVWTPWVFDWHRSKADLYDFFIIKGTPEFVNLIVSKNEAKMIFTSRHGDWYLYQNHEKP